MEDNRKLVRESHIDCDAFGRVVQSTEKYNDRIIVTRYFYHDDGSYSMEILEHMDQDLIMQQQMQMQQQQSPIQNFGEVENNNSKTDLPVLELDSFNVEHPVHIKRKSKPGRHPLEFKLMDLKNPFGNVSNKTFQTYMSALKAAGIIKDYSEDSLKKLLNAANEYPLDKSSSEIIFTIRSVADNIVKKALAFTTIALVVSALQRFNIFKLKNRGKISKYVLNVNKDFFKDSFIVFRDLSKIPLMGDFGVNGYINFDSYIKYLGVDKKEGMKLIHNHKIDYKYINDTIAISEDSVRAYKMKQNSTN